LDGEKKIEQKEIEISTLETKDKAEYLVTKEGKKIRLDKIVSL